MQDIKSVKPTTLKKMTDDEFEKHRNDVRNMVCKLVQVTHPDHPRMGYILENLFVTHRTLLIQAEKELERRQRLRVSKSEA